MRLFSNASFLLTYWKYLLTTYKSQYEAALYALAVCGGYITIGLSICTSMFICFCKEQLWLGEINHVVYFNQSQLMFAKTNEHLTAIRKVYRSFLQSIRRHILGIFHKRLGRFRSCFACSFYLGWEGTILNFLLVRKLKNGFSERAVIEGSISYFVLFLSTVQIL